LADFAVAADLAAHKLHQAADQGQADAGAAVLAGGGVVALVKEFKKRFPNKLLLVDLKTMDAGEYEAAPFFAAGADITTVLGVAGLATIKGVINAANKHNAEVQVDLINVPDKATCARESAKAGAQIVGIHTGLDAQAAGQTPFADLQAIARMGVFSTPAVVVDGQIKLVGRVPSAADVRGWIG